MAFHQQVRRTARRRSLLPTIVALVAILMALWPLHGAAAQQSTLAAVATPEDAHSM
jgi:hypothetical protein